MAMESGGELPSSILPVGDTSGTPAPPMPKRPRLVCPAFEPATLSSRPFAVEMIHGDPPPPRPGMVRPVVAHFPRGYHISRVRRHSGFVWPSLWSATTENHGVRPRYRSTS